MKQKNEKQNDERTNESKVWGMWRSSPVLLVVQAAMFVQEIVFRIFGLN